MRHVTPSYTLHNQLFGTFGCSFAVYASSRESDFSIEVLLLWQKLCQLLKNPSVARDACDFSVAGDAFDLSVADDARFAIVHNRALQACVMLLDHSDQAVYVAVMKAILHVLQPNLNVLRLLHTWI